MNIRNDLALLFLLMLALILVVYYVGTASLLLTGAKVGQQLGYFLSGRDSSGRSGNPQTPSFYQANAQNTANQLANQIGKP